jgi:DNA-binding NarL/FixJ family response regulator
VRIRREVLRETTGRLGAHETALRAQLEQAHDDTPRTSPAALHRGDAGTLDERAPRGALTARELQVLSLLRTGHSNKTIGATLGISSRTAEAHVRRLMAKLGAPSRTAAVWMAEAQGLLDRRA